MRAPVKIVGLPVIVPFLAKNDACSERGWMYYPTDEEWRAQGLRIEIVTYRHTDEDREKHEARLVNGPTHAPKHLHVIRLKYFTVERISEAVRTLREEFFQKGW